MKNYLLGLTFVVLLSSCGGGGGGGGDSEPSGPTTPAPSVSLSADPTSVLLNNVSTLTWSSSNANSCSAAWTSSNATSGSEQVTITGIGNNTFTITCSGDGGSRNASVTVEGYRNTDGVVVDGYISGAEVCIDENDNWTCDTNESNTNSDNEGKFAIKYANGNLISIGGTDLDTQTLLDDFLITHKLTGNLDFMAVTPVTSVAAFMTQSSSINAALGIDPSIDVFTFDPVSNKGDGGVNDYLYEKGNQLTVLALALQNISNNINTTSETTEDYFKAISEEIENEYNETQIRVDIETEGFVSKVLENIISSKSLSISDESKSNTSKALSGVMPIIQVKSSENLTTSIIRFAISTLQNDIQTIANGTASSDIISSYTNDILNFIASDQNINADDLIPDIIAISDVATTSEDTNIDINVLLNDSYVTSSPFSLSSTNATNGSTSISNNLITYSPDADFNGSDSFSYTITQGSKTATADVNVTVEPVNDAPSIDIPSTIDVAENQTSVTTVSVSDVDGDDLTLTLGGTDADSFNLSDENVLTFKEAPSYETKSSYSITLNLSDGIETVSKDITIRIIKPGAPVITSDSVFTVAENQTNIGTVTATDPQGDSFTFTISGDEITISSSGELNFVTAPDYETKTSYSATVTVTDDEDNFSTQNVTINITNVNDNSPSFTSNEIYSVEENQTAIGSATATDADGDGITFTISGSEIEVTSEGVLTFTNAPDYEDKTTYTAIITASDGANTSTQEITVNITNVNDESPEFTSNATFSAEENQTAIGTVTATDADGDSVTFTISGSDISITSSGVLSFVNTPDYETQSAYSATVTASDGTYTSDQDITVNVTNVNDNSPSFTSNATYSAEENQTAIGTASATDADGDGISYSISGSDITINASSGVLEFVSAPDYETNTSYTATITASDGTFSTTQDITVNVENIPNVSGLAYTSRYSVMDSDIPNTDYLAYTSNDTVSDAQTLINPSVVTGYIGESDTIDVYKVSTSSSMFVNLDVVDYENDSKELRIRLYDSDGSARDFSYTSASTEANMTILLPNGGDYLIAVRQENNNSQYVLTLGQRYDSSTAEVSTDFIPEYDEDIQFTGYVPQKTKLSVSSDGGARDTIAAVELDKNVIFDLTGLYFDEPGVKGFNIKNTDKLNIKPKPSIDDNNSGLEPISQKQQEYLNNWSQLQYLRSLNSNAIFDFNYIRRTSSFTKDPAYELQWNLDRVGLEPVLNALGQDVKDVAVAVIDTGGPTPNSEAWNESNLIDGGYDFVYGYSNSVDYLATSSYTGDRTSHGTHVSTTIAAKNNGSYMNGYAVKALNINVFFVAGSGANAKPDGASDLNITNAILYAAGLENSSGSVAPNTTPIKVINLSLGGRFYNAGTCAAINEAISQGITVVAASGNEQDEEPGLINYPAACPGVISVGATNSGGGIASYSNQNIHVDITAPGGDSFDRDGNGLPDRILAFGNDVVTPLKTLAQGTSMASPQVAAAIALMYSVDNSLTPSRVENMLIAGELTNDKGDSGRDDVFGYGELNLPKAIQNLFDDISNTTTYAYTSVPFLDFDDSTTQLTLDLLKVGDGTLSVSSLSADNATGLTYNDSSADSNGFGTYTIFIDRSSIPNGEFSNTIYFNLSSGDQVAVKIYYIVGSLRERANIGKAFIAMYDASDDSLWGSLEAEVDGSVSFVANDVAPGDYYILTSTDIDNDNTVCDYGELCEYYPEFGETKYYFTVSDSNLSGYEIFLQPIIKYGGINAASTGNEVNQSNNSKSPSKPKQTNSLGKILINPIGPNKESIKDEIGVKGDKKFNTN